MPLSDLSIRNTKPGAKPQKLSDSGGLYLLLNPNGSRWWRLDFRFGGKRKTLSLGTYPDTGLKEAREKRDCARKLLASGVDPAESRKAAKRAHYDKHANSFEVVAREWFAKQAKVWAESHSSKIMLRMEKDLFPWLGSRPISEISSAEVLSVLRRMEARGAVESAHRTLQNCGQIFRYAIATGRAERNPVPDLRGALTPVESTHRAAITDPTELGGLLRAIRDYRGDPTTRCALRLAPMLFVRPGELRSMEWSELDFDAALWNIPAAKMKMREPHIVPLAPQAIAVLRELLPITGRGKYVFPSPRSPKRPMSNNGVLSALRRMGYSKEEMSGHGFRATARTILDEVLHVPSHLIEHQLAHAVRDANGRAYNRTSHLSDRRAMMEKWADFLDAIEAGGNVTPLRKRVA